MRIAFLLFLTNIGYASCRVSDVLSTIRPHAEWTLHDDDPKTLVWNSTQTVPSVFEIANATNTCQSNLITAQQQLQTDIFNIQSATAPVVVKISAMTDILKQRGLLNP